MVPSAGSASGPGAVLERWPFVGRRIDLDRAAAAVDDPATSGLLILGGPGVGKTRLAQELLAEVGASGRATASAVASTTAATVPLGALSHLLPPEVVLVEDGGPLDAVRLLARARQALAPADRRMVLHVDDAHLLDAVSLTLLTQLVHDDAVFLVLTVRSGEPVPDALDVLLRGEHLLRIDLEPLDPDAVDTLLHLALGAPLDGRAARSLRDAAEGNPLFLRELVRAATDSGALVPLDGVWRLDGPLPPARRLSELFETRLAAVDAESRTVLELLAVVSAVPLDLLTLFTDFQVLERLEAEELLVLEPATRAGDPELIRLSHPVFGEALRRSIPTLRWRSILVQHADRVEHWPGRRPDDTLRLASWRLDAGRTVDPAVLESAAHLARVGEDFELTLRLGEAAHRARPTMAAAALCGEALFELGRWTEAEEVLAAAATLPGERETRSRLVDTRTTNLLFGLMRPDDALAIAVAELDGSPGDDPTVRAELRSRIALLQMYGGDCAAAAATLGDPPLPDADDPRSARSFVMWANPGVLTMAMSGRTADAIAIGERAFALHAELGGSVGTATLHTHALTVSAALQEAGLLEEAHQLALAGHEGSVEVGSAPGQAWFALNLGRIALLRGTVTTAERWFRDALSVTSATGWLGQRAIALAGLAAATAAAGDLRTARQSLAASESFPGRFGFLAPERCLGTAWYAAADGRLADARALLLEGADHAAATGHRTAEVWLCHELARLGEADAVVDRMARVGAASDSRLVHARVAHAEATAARDPDAIAAAADALEAIGCLLSAAEAFGAAADLVRSKGDQRAANSLALRSTACLDRCEGARSSVQLSVTSAVVPLTAREREIAGLAASGLQSKQIAERLYLSVRTVNNHLQNVYTKLGVSSRAELASVLERQPTDDG